MSREQVRIAHFITELNTGGAQIALLRLLSRLNRQRFRPMVICLYNGRSPIAQELRQMGIVVVDVGLWSFWRVDGLWRLVRLLRRERPFILHCWLFHANLLGRLAGWLVGVPIVITARRNVEIGGRRRELLKRWTAGLDDNILAVCEAARLAEIGRSRVPPDKVVTIYNGIDVEPYSASGNSTIRQEFGVAPDARVLGVVGRLHPQKGHACLFAAMHRVRDQVDVVDLCLLVVGDGRLRSELETAARREKVDDVVIFTGGRRDVPQILSALDIFVLPSLWEGLPNVVLEAMAAGLPVVATAVGGTPELVVDNVTGLLVPPQNPDALASAIQELLADPIKARKMGEAGRQRVKSYFTVEQMVARTEQLYEKLLREKGLWG